MCEKTYVRLPKDFLTTNQQLFSMGYISKVFALLIVISIAMTSLIVMLPALYAQTELPTPSHPIITIHLWIRCFIVGVVGFLRVVVHVPHGFSQI
jgi:hypothetical protein